MLVLYRLSEQLSAGVTRPEVVAAFLATAPGPVARPR